ncbi:hypothetical protein ACJX0J_028082, partial [Zea mays]
QLRIKENFALSKHLTNHPATCTEDTVYLSTFYLEIVDYLSDRREKKQDGKEKREIVYREGKQEDGVVVGIKGLSQATIPPNKTIAGSDPANFNIIAVVPDT